MQITKEQLKKYNKSFAKNKQLSTIKRALVRSKLADVVYVQESEQMVSTHFSHTIPELNISNQKQSGRCWMFSGLTFLRYQIAKKLKLESFELSQSYLQYYDLLEKVNYFFSVVDQNLGLEVDDRRFMFINEPLTGDGGYWQYFVNLVKKYGIVPKSVQPENTQTSNTHHMQSLITLIAKKYAADAQKNFKAGKVELNKELREKAFEDAFKVISSSMPAPIEKFDFEYTDKDKKYHLEHNLTPLSFFEKYVEINLDDYVTVSSDCSRNFEFMQPYELEYCTNMEGAPLQVEFNLPKERLIELTVAQLRDNLPVWFACDVGKESDSKHFANEMVAWKEIFGLDLEYSEKDRIEMQELRLTHAMVFTGFSEIKKQVTKFKVENSWGTEPGFKGIYPMSIAWFKKYVGEVIIDKKYLTDEERQALLKKPILKKYFELN